MLIRCCIKTTYSSLLARAQNARGCSIASNINGSRTGFWNSGRIRRMSSSGDSSRGCDSVSHQLPKIIFFLGAPGSGKGTQCCLVSKERAYGHFSAGDLIRKERDTKDSLYGAMIYDAIKEPGKFVPAAITCSLIERAIQDEVCHSTFLIDGFPINEDNLSAWNKLMGSKTDVRCVMFLDIPEEVSVKRCLGRKRRDDTEEILRIRFLAFERETMPIVKYYESRGVLKTINAIQEPSEVFRDIISALPSD